MAKRKQTKEQLAASRARYFQRISDEWVRFLASLPANHPEHR